MPEPRFATRRDGQLRFYVHRSLWGLIPDRLKRLARGRVIVRA